MQIKICLVIMKIIMLTYCLRFSIRFYSSTEYFSLPNQLAGDFHELSKGSFDILESALTERFERVVQGALREVTHTPDFFTKHENNTGD